MPIPDIREILRADVRSTKDNPSGDWHLRGDQRLVVDANGRFDLKTAIEYAKNMSSSTSSGTKRSEIR